MPKNGSKAAANSKDNAKANSSSVPLALPVSLALVAVLAAIVSSRLYPRDTSRADGTASKPGIVKREPVIEMLSKEYAEAAAKLELRLQKTQNAWWKKRGAKRFESTNLVHVDTKDFNATLSDFKKRDELLLIAFYDYKSLSTKDLRKHVDMTADNLAAKPGMGRLGACDVRKNNYLMNVFAPEVMAGWQEHAKGSFRFGRPDFFPMVLVLFRDGKRQEEYDGVVSAEQIGLYMQRQSFPFGGTVLNDSEGAQKLFRGLGPVAVGCGLIATVNETFSQIARLLQGDIVFGHASIDTCRAALSAPDLNASSVLWARGDGAALRGGYRIAGPPVNVSDRRSLNEWLRNQRAETLAEMTPDNSHVYLGDERPLVILLLHPNKDPNRRKEAIRLMEDAEEELAREEYSLVWSDCGEFGNQFGAEGECPVVIIVDPHNMEWQKRSVAKILKSASRQNATKSPAQRLVNWLKNYTAIRMPWFAEEKRWRAKGAEDEANENKTKATEALEAEGNSTKGNETHKQADPRNVNYTEWLELPGPFPHNVSLPQLLGVYRSALFHMMELRLSCDYKYPDLNIDWSVLTHVQGYHKHMRTYAESPDEMREIVENKSALMQLWAWTEARGQFDEYLRNMTTQNRTTPELDSLDLKLRRAMAEMSDLNRKVFDTLHRLAATGGLGEPRPPRQVERRDASELSVREFFERYAAPGLPVIIAGLNVTEGEPWTLDFFRGRCNVTATLQKKNVNATSWGSLELAAELPLAEFIDTFASNETRRHWYLHDWSLPRRCPSAFGPPPYHGFKMPKYFAGDYFQRAAFNGYQHTWPSLFIGSGETESAMHIDSGGTNFWMYLLSGRKKWRFYSRLEAINLYEAPAMASYLLDVFRPNLTRTPLLAYADMYEGVQEVGELVFIPGGNPHGVTNLDDIHAISMNYVDASNIWIYLWLQLQEGSYNVVETFTDGSVPHGLYSGMDGMHFGDFKSFDWASLDYDLF